MTHHYSGVETSDNINCDSVDEDINVTASSSNSLTTSNNTQKHDFFSNKNVLIKETFVLQCLKENFQSLSSKDKSCCRVLKISSELDAIEIKQFILNLNLQEYPSLFLMKIETDSNDSEEIKEKLTDKFSQRILIIQIELKDRNEVNFYYKVKNSGQLCEVNLNYCGEKNNFDWFLKSYITQDFDSVIKFNNLIEKLSGLKNSSMILLFIRALSLPDDFFNRMLQQCATAGSRNDLLAALDAPLEGDGRVLNTESEKLIAKSDLFTPEAGSILCAAVKSSNKAVIDYLTTYCTHLIQELPYTHQVEISSTLFKKNQLDYLCDLLQSSDFPFPENFDIKKVTHTILRDIAETRMKLHDAIANENFYLISDFIESNKEIYIGFNIDNKSALYKAAELKKSVVLLYLRSKLFRKTETEKYDIYIFNDEKLKATEINVKYTHKIAESNPIDVLMRKSSIHNMRYDKKKKDDCTAKIRKYYEKIAGSKFGSDLLKVASACDELKIFFDFESCYTNNADLKTEEGTLGLTRTDVKRIFIGAETTSENTENAIRGTIAHELGHYAMDLVFDNNFKPYFTNDTNSNEFDDITKKYAQYEIQEDECNQIISRVYKFYTNKFYHRELIVRVAEIYAYYCDDKTKISDLEEKFESVFRFYADRVVPEMRKFNYEERRSIRDFNKYFGDILVIKSFGDLDLIDSNVSNMPKEKISIVCTDVPMLFFLDIYKNVNPKTPYIIMNPEILNNGEIYSRFVEILMQKLELNVFIDCSKGFQNNLIANILKKSKTSDANFIFVAMSQQQASTLKNEMRRNKFSEVKLHYIFESLTPESKNQLLRKYKVNFQLKTYFNPFNFFENKSNNKAEEECLNQQILQSISEKMDVDLLNKFFEKQEMEVNIRKEQMENTDSLNELFKDRKLIPKMKSYAFEKISLKNLSYVAKMNRKCVLISGRAGAGKSWMLRKITQNLRKEYPKKWVTYIDLKRFSNVFDSNISNIDFATFFIDKLMEKHNNAEEIFFKRLYESGDVIILFDGFDEISPNYEESVKKLFSSFDCNKNQLWITTRDYYENELRSLLKLDVVYELDNFRRQDGIELMVSVWKLGQEIDESKDYKQLAEDLTEKIYFYEDDESIGVPQFYKMIADIFYDKLNDISKQSDHEYTILKIYDEFVKMQYEDWCTRCKIRIDANEKAQDAGLTFHTLHQFFAMKGFFPDEPKYCDLKHPKKFWTDEKINSCGLMNGMNGNFFFVHETIREYFAAKFIIRLLNNRLWEDHPKFFSFIKEFLMNPKYNIVRRFINDAFGDDSFLDEISEDCKDFGTLLKEYFVRNEYFDIIFDENLDGLVVFLITTLKDVNISRLLTILKENFKTFAHSMKNSGRILRFQNFMINFLYPENGVALIVSDERLYLNNILKSWIIDQNMLFFFINAESVKNGEVFEFLKIRQKILTSDEIQKIITQNHTFVQFNMLHSCILKNDPNRLQIMWNGIWEFCNSQKNIEVIYDLLKYRTNKYFRGRTPILATTFCDSLEYHKVIWDLLLKTFPNSQNSQDQRPSFTRDELSKLILVEDNDENNFIHNAVSFLAPNVLEYIFKMLKANFNNEQYRGFLNSRGSHGKTLLQKAIEKTNNMKSHEILWKAMREIYENNETFLNLLKKPDRRGNTTLNDAVCSASADVFKLMIKKLTDFGLKKQEIKELLSLKNSYHDENLLYIASKNNESREFHEYFWKILREYFTNEEILNMAISSEEQRAKLYHAVYNLNKKETADYIRSEIRELLNSSQIGETIISAIGHLENSLQNSADTSGLELCKTKVIPNDQFQQYYCTSIADAVEHHYLTKFEDKNHVVRINTTIEDKLDEELNEKSFSNFFGKQYTIMLTLKVKSIRKKTSIFWKMVRCENFYFCEISGDHNILIDFVDDFILTELKSGGIGILEKSQNKQQIELIDIGNENNLNLLIHASIKNRSDIVDELLEFDFDVDHEYAKESESMKNAIDEAWTNFLNFTNETEKQRSNHVILTLLKNDSVYPYDFDIGKASNEVQDFVKECEELHKDVINNERRSLKERIEKYPNVSHFYDRNNESLLVFACKSGESSAYEFLISNGIAIGVHEIHELEEINSRYDDSKLYRMQKQNKINAKENPKTHLLILKSKSKIGNNDRQIEKHWKYIEEAYEVLDTNETCSKILKVAAMCKNVEIIFDFKHETSYNLAPTSSPTTQGIMFFSGPIYIAAKNLLDDRKKFIVIASLIHELCHYALNMTFMNYFNPYPMGESKAKEEYKEAVIESEQNRNYEELFKNTFELYPKEEIHSELIATVPQMLMIYHIKDSKIICKNSRKLKERKKKFSRLFKYVEEYVEPNFVKLLKSFRFLTDEVFSFKFTRLTEPMKAKILHSSISFQGEESALFEMIGNDYVILKSMETEAMRGCLIRKEELKIGDKLTLGNKYKVIKRKFIKCKRTDQNNVNEEMNEIVEFESIKELRNFILVENIGAGKSVVFEDLALMLKKNYKDHWVSLILLNQNYELLKEHMEKQHELDINHIIAIFIKILKIKSKFEEKIFTKMFHTDKVILLFDEFDAIDAKLSEYIIDILYKIKEETSNRMLISTHPVRSEQLIAKLNVEPYKFVKNFTNEEKKELILDVMENHNINNENQQSKAIEDISNFSKIFSTNNNHSIDIDNAQTLIIIAELYANNEIDLNSQPVDIFKVYEIMVKKQMKISNQKLQCNHSEPILKFSIGDVLKVLSLKYLFENVNNIETDDFKLKDLSLIKEWEREKINLTARELQCYRIATVDLNFRVNEKFSISFIHDTYPEFFVAEYIISIVFNLDDDYKDEVYHKMFKLLTKIANYKTNVSKFISSYIKNETAIQHKVLHPSIKSLIIIEIESIKTQINNEANESLNEKLSFFSIFLDAAPENST